MALWSGSQPICPLEVWERLLSIKQKISTICFPLGSSQTIFFIPRRWQWCGCCKDDNNYGDDDNNEVDDDNNDWWWWQLFWWWRRRSDGGEMTIYYPGKDRLATVHIFNGALPDQRILDSCFQQVGHCWSKREKKIEKQCGCKFGVICGPILFIH